MAGAQTKPKAKQQPPKSTAVGSTNDNDNNNNDKAETKSTAATTVSNDNMDGPLTFSFFIIFMALPYLIGFYVSKHNLPLAHQVLDQVASGLYNAVNSNSSAISSSASTEQQAQQQQQEERNLIDVDDCYERIMVNMFQGLHAKRRDDPFADLDIMLHRNGESTPCGDGSSSATSNLLDAIKGLLRTMDHCPHHQLDNKYKTEAFLTRLFHFMFAETCPSAEGRRSPAAGFYGYCDMGAEHTPILLDHRLLEPVTDVDGSPPTTYLPCHFHTFHGVRVTSLADLAQVARRAKQNQQANATTNDDKEQEEECETLADGTTTCTGAATARSQLHLYAVPAGRVFMFAPNYVGEIIPLDHVPRRAPDKPVYLKTLSLSPVVFDLVHFFSPTESADLVSRALAETTETHRIKRSSTGATGYNLNQYRTSESGYDTSGATAVAIKKRCFSVLGFDQYIESHADGLQILRYNLTTAYNTHMDWIDGSDQLEHDFESAKRGGNRFATIFLYMSDLEERAGGETVFGEAWPPGQAESDHVQLDQAIQQLRESGDAKDLEEDSWEERLVALCRSRLAVKPSSARSILFYSQKPNGEPDKKSLHGGCPVLKGTKWGANLWVWNTPRQGYPDAPRNPNYKGGRRKKEQQQQQKPGAVAVFVNKGEDASMANAELFYQDQFWGKLGPDDPPISVNTYPGHHWRVVVDGNEVYSWTIDKDEGELYFEI